MAIYNTTMGINTRDIYKTGRNMESMGYMCITMVTSLLESLIGIRLKKVYILLKMEALIMVSLKMD